MGGARKDADEETHAGAPEDGAEGTLPVLAGGQQRRELRLDDSRTTVFSTLTRISATPKSPMATARKLTPSPRSARPCVKRVKPDRWSMPTIATASPSDDHHQRFQHRSRPHVGEDDEAQDHQRELLGRPELQRQAGQQRGQQHQPEHAERPGNVGADGGDRQGRARAALAGHLVAVEAGHHRGRLTRDVHQDRRRRASVHRAVVDPRQHDDGGDGLHAERGREQDGDAAQRADPGEDAHDRAEHDAQRAVEEVHRREADREAVQEALLGYPRARAPFSERQDPGRQGDEQHPAEHDVRRDAADQRQHDRRRPAGLSQHPHRQRQEQRPS